MQGTERCVLLFGHTCGVLLWQWLVVYADLDAESGATAGGGNNDGSAAAGDYAGHSLGIGGATHLLQRLVAFGCGSGRWSTWTQSSATKVNPQVVSVTGVQPEE